MFFCRPCKEKKGWPTPWHGLFGSHGPCEVCGVVSDCYDVPSSQLPLPMTEADVINETEPF
jgi:hypothetical protein